MTRRQRRRHFRRLRRRAAFGALAVAFFPVLIVAALFISPRKERPHGA